MQEIYNSGQTSSTSSCYPQKNYSSCYNRPSVWTAPWCHCGSWGNRHCHHNPPCHDTWQHCPPYPPYPPQPPCPPQPCPPPPPWPPKPPPPKPPKPKPKPPKPPIPDSCPPDMLWLMIGYWMGSSCNNKDTYSPAGFYLDHEED